MCGKMILRRKLCAWKIVLVTMFAVVGGNDLEEWTEDAEDLVSTIFVDAVLGKTASLPCDILPDTREDRLYMVLWFRYSWGKPIYSFDVRGRSFNKGLYWSDPMALGPRAYFVTVAKPAALTIESVQLDDEGLYRCRVDFKNSPSRNFHVRLTVIVPPHQLLLYDNSGRDVSGIIGPLELGSRLVLMCEVRGGRPEPNVSWLVNERLAPEHVGVRTDNHVVVNRLEVAHVEREHLNTTFKCQASNTKLMVPQEKSARLEMNLPPLWVKVWPKPERLVARATVVLHCEAAGSRPPARLVWYKDNRRFQRGKITESSNETLATSEFTFTPTPDDDSSQLKCQAEHSALPGAGLEDSFKLNVVYPPLMTLHLGSTLNPDDIKEGDDVYFECNIRSNPREHRITWFHNDKQVTQNMSSGIILSTKSLVLQKVTRHEAGSYSCRAANARGETSSKPSFLRVQYAPVCAGITRVLAAMQGEILRVRCSVAADPTATAFLWQFNNSGETFNVSPERYVTVNGSTSELRYAPESDRDYGALACRAINAIGQQSEPCIFQIVPTARPTAPSNCSLESGTNGELAIICSPGSAGGLPQHFILEALDPVTGMSWFNITANETSDTSQVIFRLDWNHIAPTDNSRSAATLNLVIYSRNAKGISDRVLLENIAFNDAEKHTDDGYAEKLFRVIAVIIVGCVGTIVTLASIVYNYRNCRKPAKSPPGEDLLQINTADHYLIRYSLKTSPTTSTCKKSSDNQPDVINPLEEKESIQIMEHKVNGDCGIGLGNHTSSATMKDRNSLYIEEWSSGNVTHHFNSNPLVGKPGGLLTTGDIERLEQSSHRIADLTANCSHKDRERDHITTEIHRPRVREQAFAEQLPGPESSV